MTSPRQSKHIGVRAFVGTFGPGPRRDKEIPLVCGRPTNSLCLGSAQVTFVGRSEETFAIDASVDALVFHTGRPFFEGRLLEEGTIPRPEELDGKFACLLLKPNGLELLTDCLGAGSVFYALDGGFIYFSSHLGLLLSALPHVPELNDLRVAAQLFARVPIFDETHFSGIYRLPAGGRLTADLSSSETIDVRMTRGSGIKGLLNINAPRFTPDSFRALLDIGVERERYDANSVLMLSGGRDSLAIALARAPRPTRSVTYGETYSIDFLRGKRRARRLGFEFLAVPYQDWTLETYRDEIVALNAGYSGLQTAQNIVAFDWVSDKANLAAVGFLGDILTGECVRKLDSGSHERAVLPILLKKYGDPTLNKLFPNEKETITEYVMDLYRDLARDVGSHRALMILEIQWSSARWISTTFDLCDWFVPISYPFMQRRLIASSLQADIEDLRSQRISDLALARGLTERGLAKDFRGRVLERLWNRFLAPIPALCRGRHLTGRCDWQAVIGRSKVPFDDSECSHHRLSEVTKRSWQRALSGADRSPAPVALWSATIAAASVHPSLR